MKVAITGASGFVGGHLARALAAAGHEVVAIVRRPDAMHKVAHGLAGHQEGVHPHITTVIAPLDDAAALSRAFAGCRAVAHCAGINRQSGGQTWQKVHIDAARHVAAAARDADVRKIALVSFLRARPHCGSGYHESKWAAEEVIRNSGLDYTILKCGVIYGRGDHMLDHLSHALHTFPVFGLVGMRDQLVRPVAIEDVVRILAAALIDDRLPRATVAVTGPDEMPLGQAVRRVARVVGRRPLFVRLPLWFHYPFAWLMERTMRIPMVSMAQVRILSEGVVEPTGPCDALPADLQPRVMFTDAQIRKGLPEAKPFTLRDCRCIAQAIRVKA